MTVCLTPTGSASSDPSASDAAPRRAACPPTLRVLLALSTALTPVAAIAQDLPTGGTVTHGQVAIAPPSGQHLSITQGSATAAVDWQSFSIGQNNSVTIRQPSADAALLNRVTGDTTSQIHGSLNANGRIFLVNPNGIFIGPTGHVKTGSFTASTLGIRSEDFVTGSRTFNGTGKSARVTNQGTIEVVAGGYAALLGGKVSNSGVIRAPMGKVGLGAGERITLDLGGDGFLQVAIPSDTDDADLEALIDHSGSIEANGGQVHIQAATARRAVRNAINLSGVVEARTVSGRNGAITLGGGGGGKVSVTGTLRATAKRRAPAATIVAESPRPAARPHRGGAITVTGAEIELRGATLDVSGADGGGTIRVGGSERGGPGLPRAETTKVDVASILSADALNRGDGGRIIVWSDLATDFSGRISARGGTDGGDGGFAEVSGKATLRYNGLADMRAVAGGSFGTLLIDPADIEIVVTPSNANQLAAADIEAQLALSDLIIATSSPFLTPNFDPSFVPDESSDPGDITLTASLNWSSSSRLTLDADNNIILNGDIIAPSGRLTLIAQGGLGIGTVTANGAVNVGRFLLTQGDWAQSGATLPTFETTDFRVGASAEFLRVLGGDGSAVPYQITDVYGLQGIGTGSLGDFDFELANDIDAAGTIGWDTFNDVLALGTPGRGFAPIPSLDGTLDGFGFNIDGLYVDRSGDHGGLFDTIVSSGTVQFLSFTDADVSGATAGLVARLNQGVIQDITADDTGTFVTAYTFDGGGLVAINEGSIDDSFSNALVRTQLDALDSDSGISNMSIGGLVGINEPGATINASRAQGTASVQIGANIHAGGFAGTNRGSITDSVALAPFVTLDDATNARLGGFVGSNEGGLIERSHADVGIVDGALTGGAVVNTLDIGGLVGSNAGTILDSYSLTDVTGRDAVTLRVGGLVGDNTGSVDQSHSAGAVAADGTGVSTLEVGGLIGADTLSGGGTTASFWDLDTSGQAASAGGTGLNTADFFDTEGFIALAGPLGWNFETTWAPGDAGEYPVNYTTSPVIFARPDDTTFQYTGFATGFAFNSNFFGGPGVYLFGPAGETVDFAALDANVLADSANVGTRSFSYQDTSVTGSALTDFRIVSLPATATITPAPLSIEILDQTKVYGDGFTFDGSEFNAVGLLASDTATSADIGFVDTDLPETFTVAASPFAITASTVTGSGLGNYTISFVDGALTVTPAPLTITADDASKVYGDTLTFAGTEFTTAGLRNSDSVDSATLASAGAAAGAQVAGSPFAITASAASGSGLGNYTISFVDGALTVTPAPLTITADDASKVYGDTLTFAGTEFTTAGLRNSDSVDSATLASAGAAAGAQVAGSPFAITASAASGSGLGNYTISFVDGALTVTPAPLTITADDASKVYGDTLTFAGTEFTTAGLRNSDSVNSATLASAGAAAGAQVAGSPFAITASAASGSGLGNYTISFVDGALTVTPAPLTITADDASKVYGDTLTFAGTEFTTAGLRNSDSVDSATLASAGAAAGAQVAGSPFAITASAASGSGLGNYTISFVDGALTVTPAPLTITADDASKVYGDTLTFAGTEFTTAGLRNSDSVDSATLASAGAAAGAQVAGSPFAITASAASGSGLGNYTISFVDGALTVTPAPLTITADDASKVYGDTLTFAGTEFTTAGLRNSDSVDSATLASAGAAAGAQVAGSPFAITASAASGSGLGNYTISFVDGALTVTPAPLTITADDASKVYGDTLTFAGTEFTTAGLRNSDSVDSATLASAGAAAGAQVAGSPFAITASAASGSGLGNYTISFVDGALTVTPAPLTITADDASKVYGDTLTFAGTEFTTAGLRNSDSVDSATLASAGAAAGAQVAGSPFAITASAASGSGLGNYTISFVDGALTVTPAPLTITADDASKVYGDTLTFAGTEFTTAGLRNSDSVDSATLASAGAAAGAQVAGSPFAITASAASGSGLGNYTISFVDGALTVTPAPLTITADDASKVYGDTLTFAGTEFTTAGLRNSDSVDSATLASAGAAAGAQVAGSPFAITASAASGSGLGNYTISFVDGALTVTPAPLTITADDASKVYGDTLTFAGTEFTTAGLRNSDSVDSATLASAGAAAGAQVAGSPFAITASAASGSGLGNYTISFVDGALTVTPAPLTITADDASKVYGDTLTFAGTEFTTAGLRNSDSVDSATLASAGAAAGAQVAGSPFAITASAASGSGLGNYTISFVDGALTVTPAPLTITADDASKVYGDTLTFAGTEFTTAGLRNSDSVDSATLASAGAAAGAQVAGSPFAITASAASGSGLGNYTISFVDGALTVTPAPLTITADDASKVYGDTLTFAGTEFTTAGLRNSDSVDSATLASAGAAAGAQVAGSPFAITASAASGSGLGNYTISFVDGALTVTPAPLTITADDASKVYGDTLTFAGTEFTTAGLRNSDSVDSATLASAGAAAGAQVAGSPFAITASAASGSGLGNYTISFVDGALTVTPAPLTITADDASKVYGDTLTFAGTEFTTAGLRNSDSVDSATLASAGAAAGAQVAGSPFAITASAASGSGLGNYTISFVDGALTVTPAPLTITADDASKVYGDTLTFAGTEFTTAGLRNSDSVDSATLASAGAAAGAQVAGSPFAITASAASGSGLGNYTISFVDGALTVTPAPLTITADDASKVYGDTLTFAGTEFTTAGLRNSDSVDSATLASAGAAAGAQVAGSPFAITASAASGSGLGNYTISFVDGALTVTPAPLTITADDASKVYGDTLTFAGTEFTTAGLRNSDSVDSATLASAGAAAGAQVAGSPFAITASAASGSGLGNYTISFVDGALTVTPAPLTITADDASKVEGDVLTFAGTEFTVQGIRNTDAVTQADLSSTGAAAAASAANSPFAIDLSRVQGRGLGNYAITLQGGILTVTTPAAPPPQTNPVPPISGSLPNPADTPTVISFAPVGQEADSGPQTASGGSQQEAAAQAFTAVDTASTDLEIQVESCGVSDQDLGGYMTCLADALETYSNALDVLENNLPRGLENVSAIIDTARAEIAASGDRATRRLAGATTAAERLAIRDEALGEARAAIGTAKAEVRKAIALIRADDPELVRVQTRTVERIEVALDSVDTALLRAVDL